MEERLVAVRRMPGYPGVLSAMRLYLGGMALMSVGGVWLTFAGTWGFVPSGLGLVVFGLGAVLGVRRLRRFISAAPADGIEAGQVATIAALKDLFRRPAVDADAQRP